ncbi:hypothetical protein AGLY_011985, partial [Aphis glycines]
MSYKISHPFFVYYWSTNQIIIYKDEVKSYCRLAIDATGGLVQKIKRTSMNISSNNIFLYEGVINTGFGQIPVVQMVSESHDTDNLFNWLWRWKKMVIRCPHEAVCGYSLPILGAMSCAFCNVSLSEYVDKCFLCLNKSNKNLSSCYIRIDVAHMVKIFCRLKCLNWKNKHLKVFYVSCLTLLLVLKDIDDFREMLTNILTILLSETYGWLDKFCTKHNPSEQSRVYLVNRIKQRFSTFLYSRRFSSRTTYELATYHRLRTAGIKDIPIQNETMLHLTKTEENVVSGFDERPNQITTFLEDILKITLICLSAQFSPRSIVGTPLKTYIEERSYDCRQPSCNGIISASKQLSHHIFIEMDQVVGTKNVTIAHFPVELSVNNESFLLDGSINYTNGHYISYVRRLKTDTIWEIHNDLVKKIAR